MTLHEAKEFIEYIEKDNACKLREGQVIILESIKKRLSRGVVLTEGQGKLLENIYRSVQGGNYQRKQRF